MAVLDEVGRSPRMVLVLWAVNGFAYGLWAHRTTWVYSGGARFTKIDIGSVLLVEHGKPGCTCSPKGFFFLDGVLLFVTLFAQIHHPREFRNTKGHQATPIPLGHQAVYTSVHKDLVRCIIFKESHFNMYTGDSPNKHQ